jgi:hypothetical protein
MKRNKKKWSELSRLQQAAVLSGGAVQLLTTASAVKDWFRRPDTEIRGPKWLWLPLLAVQPIGPSAYLKFGRSRSAAAAQQHEAIAGE